jgi:alpha-glucosidase
MSPSPEGSAVAWWRPAVLYQIYPRSFADSNGDGIGDLQGVIDHLDHLAWLGVDAIWLSPITVSPNADFGYDVADYCDVSPEYGTLEVFDRLVAEAGRRNMKVLLDLVPNHTSDRHPWFIDSRSSPDSAHRDWYVWRDPKPDGSYPNNWVSTFGGPAWSLDEVSGQYYLHNFLPEQADLNWWNDDVRNAFDDILRFWWDRGVAGFRIDVVHMVVKDAELRDNPPATEDDPFIMQMFGQRWVYNANRPEVHDVLRRWHGLADSYDPPRALLGETSVEDLSLLASYYGEGSDELDLGFNFVFLEAEFDAGVLRDIVETTESVLPAGAWPVWTGSNHDVSRLATHWGDGDPVKIRLALLMLLTLRGTVVLYEGDEIGLTDVPITEKDQLRDPVGVRFWPAYPGRDPERSPMPWTGAPNGGFTRPEARPWLALGDPAENNVEDQRTDQSSILWFTRALIDLRRNSPDLSLGDYRSLTTAPGVWAWRRGASTTVVLNMSDTDAAIEIAPGRVALSTDRRRDDETVDGSFEVGAWQGAVIEAVVL